MEVNQIIGFSILGGIIFIMAIVNYNLSKKTKEDKTIHHEPTGHRVAGQ